MNLKFSVGIKKKIQKEKCFLSINQKCIVRHKDVVFARQNPAGNFLKFFCFIFLQQTLEREINSITLRIQFCELTQIIIFLTSQVTDKLCEYIFLHLFFC